MFDQHESLRGDYIAQENTVWAGTFVGNPSRTLFLQSDRKRQPTHHQTYGNANNGLACGGQDTAGGQNQMNGEGNADNHADETGVF